MAEELAAQLDSAHSVLEKYFFENVSILCAAAIRRNG